MRLRWGGALLGLVAIGTGTSLCSCGDGAPDADATATGDAAPAPTPSPTAQGSDAAPAADGAVVDGGADAGDAGVDASGPAPFCQAGNATCLARLDVADTNPAIPMKTMPYYRSHPFESPNPAIQNLVLVMHGIGRNADSYFAAMAGVAFARDPVHTLVVAPWMQCTDDVLASPTDLFWGCGGWVDGNRACPTCSPASTRPTTTSYDVIDKLVAEAKSKFPAIRRVTIVGYSAGGQLVNRYAAGSTEQEKTPAVQTRFVVSSPGSYLYFDARRIKQDVACSTLASCLADATSFEVPDYADPKWQLPTGCATYDDYKYGLATGTLTGYLGRLDPATLLPRYLSRSVVYVLSEGDNDGAAPAPDAECEALTQGPFGDSFRLQRGLTYHRYVTTVLGAAHRVVVVPTCPHDHACVFGMPGTKDEVFGP